ncbi:hypothetical protein NLJ89_g7980 [Agrocybe chaxingu]|uniref:Uncharacterized protein n=1 Tax=Agrocybe chaxingu TaxID=84603 RepID=A0A9W8JVM0_9AGAR|nr:hypothetical protein NLJ89_g7980 [Agrocybe chaxingu]
MHPLLGFRIIDLRIVWGWQFCKKYILAYLSFDLIETVFTQCTLILCTHALYRKTPLLIFLLSLCVATIALDIASLAKFIPGCEIATFLNDWNMRGCVMLCWSYTFMIFITLTWIPLFLLEILTTVLTIWKSYKSLSPYSLPWAKRLLWALMRDRFIYFCAIIAITVLYFLATWGYSAGITPSISHYLVIALQKGVQPALCSRLLLGLRRPLNTESTTEHGSPSSPIAFASQTTKQEETLHPR